MLDQFTQDLIQWIRVLPPSSIYLVFFVIAYLENIIPPIPGDLLVAFGGYLAAEEIIRILPVFLLTTIASVIGFMTMYWLGSHWGTQIENKRGQFWMTRFIPFKYVEKARTWMQRWGQRVIIANRFLAGTRSVISLTAGISHTPVTKTVLSSTLSSLLWNALILSLGWIVHENWRLIGHYLSIYSRIILIGIVLYLSIRVAIYYFRKYRSELNKK